MQHDTGGLVELLFGRKKKICLCLEMEVRGA